MKASSKSPLGFTLIELLVTLAIIAILASLLLVAVSRGKSAGLNAKCKSNLHQLGLALSMYVSDAGAYPRGWLETFPPPGHSPNMRGMMYSYWFGRLFPYCSIPYPADPNGVFKKFPDVFNCPGSEKDLRFKWSRHVFGREYVEINGVERRPYGYNMVGAMNTVAIWPELAFGGIGVGLGLGTECREGDVVATANMIAIGCVQRWGNSGVLNPQIVSEHGYTGPGGWHNGRANIVFCDGHVEAARTNAWNAKNETARARWNRDNKPHPEFW